MKVEQRKWTEEHGWLPAYQTTVGDSAQLVLVFGSTSIQKDQKMLRQVKESYQQAHILGCSTAGEICGTAVSDDSLVSTAVKFEYGQIRIAKTQLQKSDQSFDTGVSLAKALPSILPSTDELRHLFVISD